MEEKIARSRVRMIRGKEEGEEGEGEKRVELTSVASSVKSPELPLGLAVCDKDKLESERGEFS